MQKEQLSVGKRQEVTLGYIVLLNVCQFFPAVCS